MDSPLIRFYRGTHADDCGRTLEAILAWTDRDLEGVHDYIQWLFPLDEPSAFNLDAPLVTSADGAAFKNEPALTTNLQRAFVRMLAFYGFVLTERNGQPSIARDPAGWAERSAVWLSPGNHNFLRLTRIMKSLVLLGQPGLAHALFEALAAEYRHSAAVIGPRTLAFWKDAGGH